MRIAMIGQKGIPAHSGGIEHHVEILATELSRRGHEVSVYCRQSYLDAAPPIAQSPAAQPPERSRENQLHCILRPSIPTKHLDTITHCCSSTWDAIHRGFDLIHYHAIGPSCLVPIAKMRKIPTVVTIHGLDWQRAKWNWFAKRCLRIAESIGARFADQVVTVSEQLRQYYQKQHGVEARFIPNGVTSFSTTRPDRIKRWGLKTGGYLLSATRLVPEKGIHYLIEAFSSLNTEFKLVIAGSGGLESEYERKLKEMAGPNVVFTGNADRDLLGELYANARIFVLPSELEGMSVALLEAMNSGLPVVVSDIPENTCVVGQAGFSFRNKDSNSLVQVLSQIIDDEAVLKEAGESAKHAAERFQWPLIASELEDVYFSVVDLSKSRPEAFVTTRDGGPQETQSTPADSAEVAAR